MDSSELYHIKQQFILGAYKALAELTLPDPSPSSSFSEYKQILLYKARSCIALGNPQAALSILPSPSEEDGGGSLAVKAVAALARYVACAPADGLDGDVEKAEAALEELRDLCVEIDGGEDDNGDDREEDVETEREKGMVRVLAGTAFVRAGEVEEALETLGAGTEVRSLEGVALIVHTYLTINRADLAKKEFEKAKKWAEDDLLLQFIESSIGLVTGKDGYADCNAFYTEQLANPSLSAAAPRLLTARGVTRLLRGEVAEAKSDFEESIAQAGSGGDSAGGAETVAAYCVAAGLKPSKKGEADEWWSRLTTEYPKHPLVVDVASKAELFDQLASKFDVPSLPVVSQA